MEEDEGEFECLVLGPGGAGKTALLKRLQSWIGSKDEEQVSSSTKQSNHLKTEHSIMSPVQYTKENMPSTHPTTGTHLVSLASCKCLLKEYGYSMCSLWSKAVQHTGAIIYVVDTSNPQQISAATVLLMELLSHQVSGSKPVLLYYTKTDLPSPMSVYEMKEVMRVRDLTRRMSGTFTVLSGSSATGEGLEEVFRWITSLNKQ